MVSSQPPPPPTTQAERGAYVLNEDHIHLECLTYERENSYYLFRTNQQKASTKIYSLTQCSLSVNECGSRIFPR